MIEDSRVIYCKVHATQTKVVGYHIVYKQNKKKNKGRLVSGKVYLIKCYHKGTSKAVDNNITGD